MQVFHWRVPLAGRRVRREVSGNLRRLAAGASITVLLHSASYAQDVPDPIDHYPAETFNFYGEAGLLEMPSANLNPDGELSATVSSTHAIDRYNLGFQALPWLEATFRYSRIDRWDGAAGDLYDRSLSIKARLLQETDYFPSIAIGAQDIIGTGALGAEYLVASKRAGDFDFTAGLGWRRFAGVATFPNPFGLISNSFKQNAQSQGIGVPLLNELFHGPNTGVFGGVSWQTPVRGLQLIAELSGDDYVHQSLEGGIKIKSHLNFGFSYEPASGIQIGGGYLYGSEFGVRVSFFMNAFDDTYENTTRLGTPPLPMQIRTSAERNTAELNALQNLTHFYSNWPGASAQQQANVSVDQATGNVKSMPLLADVLFEQRAQSSNITHVEIYGNNLLIEVRGRSRDLSCNSTASIANVASLSGFNLIALSSANDPADVKICPIASPKPEAPVIQNTDFVVAGDDRTASDDGAPIPPISEFVPVYDAQAVRKKIVADAKDQGLTVVGYLINGERLDIAFANGRYRTQAEAVGRLLRVVMADAPDEITGFRFIMMVDSVPGPSILLHRADVERVASLSGAAAELLPTTPIIPVSVNDPIMNEGALEKYPEFNWDIAPEYQQSLFDPAEPYRFGIYAGIGGSVALSDHFLLGVQTRFNIYNTFGSIDRLSNSVLPHVRSDFALYLKHGADSIESITAQYLTKLAPDVYFLGRAGYVEQMFGGVGGEVYWRPEDKRYSFGATLYEVQQRNFDDLFGFRNYRVLTGHLSMYYQSPYKGLDFELHVGRYLAGDYGATFQVTRRFDSGIEIGAYVTLTNVPFSEFGEGSFDKGFIIHIPVDFMAPVNTQDEVQLDFSPLTRDGGQRLAGEQTLFYATRSESEGELLPNWSKVIQP